MTQVTMKLICYNFRGLDSISGSSPNCLVVFLYNVFIKAGFLGVITRLRNAFLASLRDSPKPRPYICFFIQDFGLLSGKGP